MRHNCLHMYTHSVTYTYINLSKSYITSYIIEKEETI